MRTVLVLLHVVMVSTGVTQATTLPPVPFGVECKAPETPALTLTDTTLLITGKDGCKVTGTFPTFTLAEACKTTGSVVVEKVSSKTGIVTALKDHVYNVACQGENGVVTNLHYNPLRVHGPTDKPLSESFTMTPRNETFAHLILLKSDPASITGGVAEFKDITEANLGDSLYLTLYSDAKSGIKNVIPLSCEAKQGTGSANLWKLHQTAPATGCFREQDVVTAGFAQKTSKDSDPENIYVAEIEAFRFRDNEDKEITFSCQVRVCATETGLCGDDKVAVDHCGTTPAAAPAGSTHSRRRRRDVEEDALALGRLDQVTTKLRVIGGGVTFASAGSATFSLSSSLMLTVTMVILWR